MVLLCGTTAVAQTTDKVTINTATGGSVVVDNLNPASGETVTITVKPDVGYKIEKADIIVEATIDPGFAHAPAVAAPMVGYFLPLEGNQPYDTTAEASYTFVMPEEPLNALVTAQFKKQTITGVNSTAMSQPVTGVRYVDLSGRVSTMPHMGINVVVTTYADGTRTVTRMMK